MEPPTTAMPSRVEFVSVEHHQFVGRVYDLAMPVHLGEHDYDELQRIAPDRAYVVDVERRLSRLVERCESINTVLKFLAFEKLPLATSDGHISRIEWLRTCLDSALVRLTSIRDCSLLLVADVMEFGLNPRHVTPGAVLKHRDLAANPLVTKRVAALIAQGPAIRDERDRHVHRAEERRLGRDAYFRAAATMESWGQGVRVQAPNREDRQWDIRAEYGRVRDSLRKELFTEGKRLERRVLSLMSALSGEFEKRWREKRKRSQI